MGIRLQGYLPVPYNIRKPEHDRYGVVDPGCGAGASDHSEYYRTDIPGAGSTETDKRIPESG